MFAATDFVVVLIVVDDDFKVVLTLLVTVDEGLVVLLLGKPRFLFEHLAGWIFSQNDTATGYDCKIGLNSP